MTDEKDKAPEESHKKGDNTGQCDEGWHDKGQRDRQNYDKNWAPPKPRMQAPFPWPDPPDEKKE